MSHEAFNRRRRSLNIISAAIIIYFTTGVEFGGEANLLSVTIRHEVVAYSLIWVAFFYFWWRFYLFGKDARYHWKMDFLFELSRDPKYRTLYSQPESDGQHKYMVWTPKLHFEGFRRHLSWEEAYLVGIIGDDGQIQFTDQSTFSDSINPQSQKWNVGPETVIPLTWTNYFFPALKATLAAITHRSGTEWVLPNFLACFALTCGISSLITKYI